MEPEISRFILDKDRAVLLVVDVQEKLIPTLPEKAYRRTLRSLRFLLKGARLLDIPVVATEQYPKGLGHTTPELAATEADKTIEKVSFSCCGEPAFLEFLEERGRSQVNPDRNGSPRLRLPDSAGPAGKRLPGARGA